jgi:hypothetical protein
MDITKLGEFDPIYETAMAYGDSNGVKERMLHWKHSKGCWYADLIKHLEAMGNYNAFEPQNVYKQLEKLEKFDMKPYYYPAREGSACLYIHYPGYIDAETLIELREAMIADEAGYENGMIRFWWD